MVSSLFQVKLYLNVATLELHSIWGVFMLQMAVPIGDIFGIKAEIELAK